MHQLIQQHYLLDNKNAAASSAIFTENIEETESVANGPGLAKDRLKQSIKRGHTHK